ncbi:unnamed protein product, partial [Brenthis ino]
MKNEDSRYQLPYYDSYHYQCEVSDESFARTGVKKWLTFGILSYVARLPWGLDEDKKIISNSDAKLIMQNRHNQSSGTLLRFLVTMRCLLCEYIF